MAEVTKVTETSSQGLEPVNFKLISQYDQLRALLASRLTPDHAFLLAEPVPLGGSKESGRDTAWYVAGSGEASPLGSLQPEQIDAVEQSVRAQIDDISRLATELVADGGASRELGKLLQDALVFPDSMQIFLVDGRPVLVNWGYRKQAGTPGAKSASNNVLSGGRQPKPVAGPPGRPIAGAAPAGAAAARPIPQPDAAVEIAPARRSSFGRRRLIAAALWIAFVVLLGLIGIRLLDACALGSSTWPSFIRNMMANECAGTSPDLRAANDAARALEAMIHQKQLVVAARLAECKAACAPTPPTPGVNGSLTPVDIDKAIPSDARRGKIEVTLAWQGPADLDLHIICPDGREIRRDTLINCGGEMVTDDLNKGGGQGSPTSTWVEHVIWNTTPVPNGTYQVRAVMYARSREINPTVQATAILRVDGVVVKTASPGLTTEYRELPTRQSDTIFTFNVPADTAGGRTNAR